MRTNILIVIFAAALAKNIFAADTNHFIPSNPPEMTPIAGHNTPAYREAKLFKHGANLGDYLESWPTGSWNDRIFAQDFVEIKQQGFDHVRVPIGWHHYAGPAPDYTLSPEIFYKVDFVVSNALKNKLAVIINIHHFNELDANPTNAADEFLKIWRQIGEHYKNYPNPLAFELDNEPHENATTALMNPIDALAIAAIRETNLRRTIFVEPGGWGSIDQLTNLILPPDDNVIVSVHCYDPFFFTHQGATWAGEDVKHLKGIQFPGPPATPLALDETGFNPWVKKWIENYNTLPAAQNPSGQIAFESKLRFVRAWSDYYGRPVHLGEFGAFTKADEQSRANFYSAFRHACERQNIGWCIWDWDAGFRYWDKKNNQPMPKMHEALFGY